MFRYSGALQSGELKKKKSKKKMTVFKLEKFPHVCRLCLEPDTGGLMLSLDSADPALDWATIRDFLASFTVPIAEVSVVLQVT